MSEQTNTVTKTLTDEELDGVSGGAVGINPLLLLNSGGQGIYNVTSESHATVTTGVNPLYVDHTNLAGPSAPVYTPTHDVAPVPQATAPTHVVTPAPPTPAPTHDTSVVIVDPSASLGHSLNIASPISSTIHLSGTVTVTGTPAVHEPPQPQVSVMTLTTPSTTYTPITATVNGVRSATGDSAHPGTHSPLENAFDLGLVKT